MAHCSGVSIWLVGLMGSGKSTVGRALAPVLGYEYVDNDATIAVLAGRSTVELAASGGTSLHDWESRYVHDLVANQRHVVAGIPASAADRPDNLHLLSDSGAIIYLRCDVDTLVRRIQAGGPRPWLTDNVRQFIEATMVARDPMYLRVAHEVIDGTLPVPAIVDIIVAEMDDRSINGTDSSSS
jgi:shikimate kinase